MVTGGLSVGSSSFDLLVERLLAPEKKPIDGIKSRQDALKTRTAMFSDLKGMLSSLKTLAADLSKTGSNSIFRTGSVTSSEITKLTATADSTAVNSSYSIIVSQFAKAHRVAAAQASATDPLGTAGTFRVNGQDIVVGATHSLYDVRDAINAATYASGQELVASVVDKTLVIQTAATGASKVITASDQSGTVLQSLGVLTGGGAFANQLQASQNASFTIDGVASTSEINSGITSAVSGLTVNLKAESATAIALTVATDNASITTRITNFLNKLHEVTTYLSGESKVEATASTYSRGALAGDPVFTSLHLSILNAISLQVTGLPGGQPSYLADLGITFDSTQKGSVTDATKLNDFLSKNPTHAEQVFNSANGIATKLVALLDPYAQTGGIVDETVTVLGNQKRSLDLRVLSLQERLSVRERQIRSQLSSMQGVLVGLAQQQSILGATLGFLSNAGR